MSPALVLLLIEALRLGSLILTTVPELVAEWRKTTDLLWAAADAGRDLTVDEALTIHQRYRELDALCTSASSKVRGGIR